MKDAAIETDIQYPGWRVVLASSGCVFVSFASLFVYTFGIFLKPLVTEFHWTREAVSAAFGFAALAVAACSPALGELLDGGPTQWPPQMSKAQRQTARPSAPRSSPAD